MDETLHCRRNQCQWISLIENITGHSISETGKRCLTKTVPKLTKLKKKSKEMWFYNWYQKLEKLEKNKNLTPKRIKENQMTGNLDRRSRPPFDNNRHFHHRHTAYRPYH